MPTLAIVKTYTDGQILNASDLDNAYDAISTFVNVTKLDSDNLQANAVTTTQITANSVVTSKIADAQVTLPKFAADASAFLMPTGTILAYGATSAPTGYLLCDGSSYLRATYAALFAIIGTSFGAADGTHFNAPDLRGRFLRGRDGAAARDPDRASRTAMNATGATGDNVGSIQDYTYQSHNHGGSTSSDGAHTHSYTLSDTPAGAQVGGGPGNTVNNTLFGATTSSNGAHTHTISSGGGNETRPLNAYVQYIIKT